MYYIQYIVLFVLGLGFGTVLDMQKATESAPNYQQVQFGRLQ